MCTPVACNLVQLNNTESFMANKRQHAGLQPAVPPSIAYRPYARMHRLELQSPLWSSSCHACTNATKQLLLLRQGPVMLLGTTHVW